LAGAGVSVLRHPEAAEVPLEEAASVLQHLEVAEVRQEAAAVSAPQRPEAVGAHPEVVGASLPEVVVVSGLQAGVVAWARQEGPVASGGRPRREVSAGRLRPGASGAHPPQVASAGRVRRGGRAFPWRGSPSARGRPRPGTARTAGGRTSRVSAVPPLPPPALPGRGPGPVFRPSTPGKRRRSRRTRLIPCCGSRTSCTRSRSVHLHSVHDMCRLGGGHRRVDQIHGDA
jgi:hypothetical protein